jgi:hypothetical protein
MPACNPVLKAARRDGRVQVKHKPSQINAGSSAIRSALRANSGGRKGVGLLILDLSPAADHAQMKRNRPDHRTQDTIVSDRDRENGTAVLLLGDAVIYPESCGIDQRQLLPPALAETGKNAPASPCEMTRNKIVLLFACAALLAALPSGGLAAEPGSGNNARIDNARIFPFFASGGGWESTITLNNVFESSIGYTLRFRGINGQPAQVTFRAPDGRMMLADTIQGQLGDDSSTSYVLADVGPLQTGWAVLEYDGESRIGGMLTFRQRVSGRPDFESSVVLTRDDETRVYMPFDNTQSYSTTLAITNPSSTENTGLRLRFWDPSGSEIITRDIQLSAGTTIAFSLPERYPELVGRLGQLRIESTGGRLSTIALRFNPSGAFSTVPVVSR